MALVTSSSPTGRCAEIETERHETDENSFLSSDSSRDLQFKARSLGKSPRTESAKIHTDKAKEDSSSQTGTVNAEPLDDGLNLANLECETPKSRRYKRLEAIECPPAPRKPHPKRRRQSSVSKEYFVPPDLDILPVHIQALFR